MKNHGLLQNMGGWSQLFFFIFLAFTGLIFASLLLILIVPMDEINMYAKSMRIAQSIQMLFLFLLPSLAFASLCQESPKVYFGTANKLTPVFVLAAIGLIIVVQPLINTISYYNHQLSLPESLASLENWMRESEESAEKVFGLLFSDKSPSGLILNLLVIAAVAGLAEELFFRGCLQQIIRKIVNNKHAAIWITAIIFSIIHFQFYGFIPRVLLGALLGYLFVWSGSISVPIIVHTMHNAINVIISHIYYGTPKYEQLEDYSFPEHTEFIILSFILSIILLFVTYKKRAA